MTSPFATYPSLTNRVIVISGGAQGIGAAMVEQLALQGARVHFLDIATDRATQLIDAVSAQGVPHKPVFHHCDVTNIKGALQPTAAKILSENPKVHGVVNNACGPALSARVPTMDVTPEIWNASIGINLSHQFFLTQALLPGLLNAAGADEGAAIVNMGSITWAVPSVGVVPYATCKAAVVGLTRTLAHEFGPKGVRVNSIMPGSTATEAEKRDIHTTEYKNVVLGRQALKRFVQPVEVARTAMWLLADDSGAITNQSIVVDAGWT